MQMHFPQFHPCQSPRMMSTRKMSFLSQTLTREIPADSTSVGEFRKATAEDTTLGNVSSYEWLARVKRELSSTYTRILHLKGRDQCREWSTLQGTQTYHS